VGLLVVLVVLAVVKSQDVRKKYRRALEHRLRNFLNSMQYALSYIIAHHKPHRIDRWNAPSIARGLFNGTSQRTIFACNAKPAPGC